jgi:hypothetical protein
MELDMYKSPRCYHVLLPTLPLLLLLAYKDMGDLYVICHVYQLN